MDIEKCVNFIDNNIGRKVIMEIKRMGAKENETIIGTINEPFSNEDSPSCKIKTEKLLDEIFLGEILSAEFA
ncbi:MAG: hypothetical protein NT085_04655 [candidate division SR1 bacterium]|nr:hypothetical protein [candidate division SR1 bacterium]